MGGIGSGRDWICTNSTVDNYRAIDIRKWHREGMLIPDTIFRKKWTHDGKTVRSLDVFVEEDCVTLKYQYRHLSKCKYMNYSIDLEWTSCNLGGKRPWFLCPARRCGRRVAILYGGAVFSCRHCYRLAYPSQRENHGDRASRKANKMRQRLGWKPGIFNEEPLKPKGMHWKTFERLFFLYYRSTCLFLKETDLRWNKYL